MRALVIVVVVVGVGCTKTSQTPASDAAAKPAIAPVAAKLPPDGAPVAPPTPDAASGSPASGLPALEKERFGTLVAGKKVTKKGLAKMFPGLVVEPSEDYVEDEAIPGFAVKRGEEVLVRVRTTADGKVLSVIVDAADVPVAVGVPVGADAAKLVGTVGDLACWTEFEWDGSLLCKGDQADNVTFVIARDGGYPQDSGDEKPASVKKLLAKGKIENVVWVPR